MWPQAGGEGFVDALRTRNAGGLQPERGAHPGPRDITETVDRAAEGINRA